MTSILACDWCSVADSSVVFDSEYMVFVSPPPAEKSKAVAPIMPFNIYVCIYYLLSIYLLINSSLQMWGVVIGTLMIFALGILASAWILYATDPGKVGHQRI